MNLTTRWFGIFLFGGVFLLLGGVMSQSVSFFSIWCTFLIVATVIDILRMPDRDKISVQRTTLPFLTVNSDFVVSITIRNADRQSHKLQILDEPPASMLYELPRKEIVIEPCSRYEYEYSIRPKIRGTHSFGTIWVKITGKLGLVNRTLKIDLPSAIKVYPQLKDSAKFTLLARKGRLQQIGMRNLRSSGSGKDFESLREYQTDDEYRSIDWKATARSGKLICRQYQTERSQNVILVLDIGRTMLAEIDGKQKLEFALDAAILLAHVASLSDDRIGLLVFSDRVHFWLPPKRGRTQVYAIIDALHDVRAGRMDSDYRSAFAYMSSQWRRRSLVVCFTDIWDPHSSNQTILELSSLQPRHLVACVTLVDTKVLAAAHSELDTHRQMYERGVSLQILEDRHQAGAKLRRRGVLVVDSPADQLSLALVNQYLKVKERSLL